MSGLKVKYRSQIHVISIDPSTTLQDVKDALWSITEVLPSEQKLMGLPKGKGSEVAFFV